MDFAPRGWSSSLVYGRLSCPPGLFVQGLETLPPELLVMIMSDYCSINDIKSLISASPVSLSCFKANKHLVLGPRCRIAKTQLGELLPMALFDIRLRHLREKHDHLGAKAVEWLISHLLEELSVKVSLKTPRGLWPATEDVSFVWRDSLPKLAHLERLISETDSIMTSYATKRWEEMQEKPTRHVGRVVLHGFPVHVFTHLEPEPLKLSTTEYNRLLETLICLDIYCNAFFYDGRALFHGDWAFRRLICWSRTNPNKDMGAEQRMTNFYTMLNFILDRFSVLLKPTCRSLRNQSGWHTMPRTEGLRRFMTRSMRDHMAFIRYLCSRGYSVLLQMEELKGQTQRECVVETFLHFTSLSSPPIWFEEPFDVNDIYFHRTWQWMPWLESDWYHDMHSGLWEIETGFWDEERLDSIRDRLKSWASRQIQNGQAGFLLSQGFV